MKMLTNLGIPSIKLSRELGNPWPEIEEGVRSMTENGIVEAEGKSIYGSKRKTTTRRCSKGGIVSKVTS